MTDEASVAEARVLAAQGRVADAVAMLKAAGRLDVAVELRRAGVEARPQSAVAEHNLAAVLGDAGRAAEAEEAARRAFAKGGDAPETWLVLARALLARNRHDQADAAYGEAIRRRLAYADAVRERAQLIWMTTGDREAALAPFAEALSAEPGSVALKAARAAVMAYAGAEPEAVLAALEPDAGRDADLALAAAQAAMGHDLDRALAHARTAHGLRPDVATTLKLAEAHLARGEAEAAAPLIETVLAARPDDQNALSLDAVARRLTGRAAYDYDGWIGAQTIDTPAGWASLNAYLADLAPALRRLHGYREHPVGQSLRHGSQTTASLIASEDPVVRAFFDAVKGPIDRHVAALGKGADPVRRRNTGRWRIAGAWSVELRPGGFHAAHVHPEGWLSSACYIDLPDGMDEGRAGWIGFGAPPFRPDLTPERFEKPEPGKLVLFPSFLWHGTVPFAGDRTRLTVAFDVVPA